MLFSMFVCLCLIIPSQGLYNTSCDYIFLCYEMCDKAYLLVAKHLAVGILKNVLIEHHRDSVLYDCPQVRKQVFMETQVMDEHS